MNIPEDKKNELNAEKWTRTIRIMFIFAES